MQRDTNLTMVRTYADEGRSGLQINGRQGLLELIDDVRAGRVDFDRVLVYDVSRWGRFQDTERKLLLRRSQRGSALASTQSEALDAVR